MAKIYYACKDKTSNKFWEIETKRSTVTVRYGKIGTDGQTTVKKFGSPAAAAAHAKKVTAAKVKKGYRKIQLGTSGARPALFKFSVRREYRLSEEALSSFAESLLLPTADSLRNLAPKYGKRGKKTEEAYKKIEKTLCPHIEIDVLIENVSSFDQVFNGLDSNITLSPILSDARLNSFKIDKFGMEPEDESTRIWIEVEFKVQLDVLAGLEFDGTDGDRNADLEWLPSDLDTMSSFRVTGLDGQDGVEDLLDNEASYQQTYEVKLL